MCEFVNICSSEDSFPTAAGEPLGGLLGTVRESELEFYSRRAMEEARSARRAVSPQAAAAHRYLAAAYAALVAKETQAEVELEELAKRIP
jgi:hypothetical protein